MTGNKPNTMRTSTASRLQLSPKDYADFQSFLQDASGILLGDGKEYLVSSRLNSLMREHEISDVGELVRQLNSSRNMKLRTNIIDAMTTNETFWFRDMPHYRLLTEQLLPELSAKARRPLKIWSAACSSGQEPYNISMVVQDFMRTQPGRLSGGVDIMATDISSSVLVEARKGLYCGMSASRGLSHEQRSRYFSVKGDCLEVMPDVKRRVSFRELNLTKGYELLGKFDIIFCRNVLIYFSSTQKQDILNRMARALQPGGYLFLGSTESLSSHTNQFKMVSGLGGIVYRLK